MVGKVSKDSCDSVAILIIKKLTSVPLFFPLFYGFILLVVSLSFLFFFCPYLVNLQYMLLPGSICPNVFAFYIFFLCLFLYIFSFIFRY